MRPARIFFTIAALAVIGFIWQQNGDDGIEPVQPIRIQYIDSVAVLPLENRTGDDAFDHVGVGIAEEITTHLARMAPLKVISHHSAQAVNQQELTTSQLGNALNVRHIIRGSIDRRDDRRLFELEMFEQCALERWRDRLQLSAAFG